MKNKSKYVYIYKPNHPNSDVTGWIKRSRFVLSNILNRPLTKEEVVHHKNRVKRDDRPENLKLFKNDSEHRHIEHGFNITFESIKDLVGDDVINWSEFVSKIMNEYDCSYVTAYKVISKHIDKFEVWIEKEGYGGFPSKLFKNRKGK